MSEEIYLLRGMTIEECKTICTSPIIPLREKSFFRGIYETLFRPIELLQCNIEDWNRKTGEITAHYTKRKYSPKIKTTLPRQPRTMYFTRNTNEMIRKIVGNRKKGPIWINRNGERISLRYMEKKIDYFARLLGIQKLKKITSNGKKYNLVTLMALREAGERHHDLRGGDADVSAAGAGHTKQTKAQYYKKTPEEEIRESMKRHHPAFTEGW